MKKIIIPAFVILNFISILTLKAEIKKLEYRDWSNCYQISNKNVKVIINASAGGRVMRYEINGTNIIYENKNQNGKLLDDYIREGFDPDGGRFDIGQELVTKDLHENTYMGPWTVEITDNYTLEITSVCDLNLGLQLTRTFCLDQESSHLRITFGMKNISKTLKEYFFWGRTLVPVGGKLFMPLNPSSSISCGWGRYIWGNPVQFECDPDDSGVSVQNNVFSLIPSKAANEKYGNDSYEGWMAYGYKGIIFLKTYKQPVKEKYIEHFKQTNIFYTNRVFAEMEPISPVAILKTGDTASFTENWYLINYTDAESPDFDVLKAAKFIRSKFLF